MIIYNDDGTMEIDGIVYDAERGDIPKHDKDGIPVEGTD